MLRAARQADLQPRLDLAPALAVVRAAKGVAAQAEGDYALRVTGHAEIRPLVGRLDRAETARLGVQAHEQSLFAGHVDLARRLADGVEVQRLRVVGAIEPWLPRAAAILGAQDEVEGADHEAGAFIGEPDVQEGIL